MSTCTVVRCNPDLYLNATANFGEPGSEVGIDAAAAWYKRNMLILKNIDRVTKPGEKLSSSQARRIGLFCETSSKIGRT